MNYIISKLPDEREKFKEVFADWEIVEKPPECPEPGSRLFFYHYSERIPEELFLNYECIGFHMTDLPFGRGGSPIQNLIMRGYTKSVVSMFRITNEMDAGDIYYKVPISLDGTITEILLRGADTAIHMIQVINGLKQVVPIPQTGEPFYFHRLSPQQSVVNSYITDLKKYYDHIRMLDGDGYPPAFTESGMFRYEFKNAKLDGKTLTATVTITGLNT